VSFGNELTETAVLEEAGRMRAELLGPAPSVVERVLASNLVVAYLAAQHAALAAADAAPTPAVVAMRDRRLESAQRRLAAAARAWLLLWGKQAKGVAPPQAARLFAPAAGA
jgi:hypothetical protein